MITCLHEFVLKATKDCRITRGHLALYLALFYLWQNNGLDEPLMLYSHNVMPIAKISSNSTYHRLIKDLNDFGFIRYEPSYYKGKPSSIWLLKNEERR